METAAVPARNEWLAPLAVLVSILATVVAGVWCLEGRHILLAVALPAGLFLTALAGWRAYGVWKPVLAGFLTLVACFPAFVILLWASYQNSICGKEIHGIWDAVLIVGGLLVFFALGVFGFRTRFAPAIVPIAFLAAVLAVVLLSYLVPGTPSYCGD